MSVQEVEKAIVLLSPKERAEIAAWLKQFEDEAVKSLRPYGLAAGEFVVPKDFDAPLPDEILREFIGQR